MGGENGHNNPSENDSLLRQFWPLVVIPIVFVAYEYKEADGLGHFAAEMFWSRPWTRPLSMLILVLWGYSFNNWVFSRSGIDTSKVFVSPQPPVFDAIEAAAAVTWLFITLHTLPFVGVLTHYTYNGMGVPDATHHLLLSGLFFGVLCVMHKFFGVRHVAEPFNLRALLGVLRDCVTTPCAGPVTFAHVLIADYLTSLAKTFADVSISFCVVANLPLVSEWPSPAVAEASRTAQQQCTHSLMVPAVILIPTAIRVMQCWKVYRVTGEPFNLVNLVKYLTTVPVVLISILKKRYPAWWSVIAPMWALCVVLNSSYATAWDLGMDWGLFEVPPGADETLPFWQKPRRFRTIRRYPLAVYVVIGVLNFILRFTWSLKLLDFHLALPGKEIKIHLSILKNDSVRVFLFSALEVFRRNCWTVLRVEWEEVKHLPVETDELLSLQPLSAGPPERGGIVHHEL